MTPIQLSNLTPNPNNPRVVIDHKFEKLKKSLEAFPKMMELRPIIVDENNMILGGNMRYQALLALAYTAIPAEWVKKADDLTKEEKQEFIIKDNLSFGGWDYDELEANWETDKLEEWGLDMPDLTIEPEKECINEEKPEKITLEYTASDMQEVKAAFSRIGGTPEKIVWNLLNLGSNEL